MAQAHHASDGSEIPSLISGMATVPPAMTSSSARAARAGRAPPAAIAAAGRPGPSPRYLLAGRPVAPATSIDGLALRAGFQVAQALVDERAGEPSANRVSSRASGPPIRPVRRTRPWSGRRVSVSRNVADPLIVPSAPLTSPSSRPEAGGSVSTRRTTVRYVPTMPGSRSEIRPRYSIVVDPLDLAAAGDDAEERRRDRRSRRTPRRAATSSVRLPADVHRPAARGRRAASSAPSTALQAGVDMVEVARASPPRRRRGRARRSASRMPPVVAQRGLAHGGQAAGPLAADPAQGADDVHELQRAGSCWPRRRPPCAWRCRAR